MFVLVLLRCRPHVVAKKSTAPLQTKARYEMRSKGSQVTQASEIRRHPLVVVLNIGALMIRIGFWGGSLL